jgi:hypothetical protein
LRLAIFEFLLILILPDDNIDLIVGRSSMAVAVGVVVGSWMARRISRVFILKWFVSEVCHYTAHSELINCLIIITPPPNRPTSREITPRGGPTLNSQLKRPKAKKYQTLPKIFSWCANFHHLCGCFLQKGPHTVLDCDGQ